jgi:hypothetical protein
MKTIRKEVLTNMFRQRARVGRRHAAGTPRVALKRPAGPWLKPLRHIAPHSRLRIAGARARLIGSRDPAAHLSGMRHGIPHTVVAAAGPHSRCAANGRGSNQLSGTSQGVTRSQSEQAACHWISDKACGERLRTGHSRTLRVLRSAIAARSHTKVARRRAGDSGGGIRRCDFAAAACPDLWINMTIAVLLGLMLAFEPKEPDIMRRPPRDPKTPILDIHLCAADESLVSLCTNWVGGLVAAFAYWRRRLCNCRNRKVVQRVSTCAVDGSYYPMSA